MFTPIGYFAPQGAPFSPDDISGLQLWYDIADPACYPGSGTSVTDLKQIRPSGYRDATINGSYSYDATSKSIYIDNGAGGGSNIELSSNSSYPFSTSYAYSISVWVKIVSFVSGYARIWRTGTTGNSNYLTLGHYLGSSPERYSIYDGNWNDSGQNITMNAWTNITVTYSLPTYKIYENGSLIWTNSAGSPDYNEEYLLYLMGTTNSEGSVGYLGAAYVYDKELNSTEVSDIYNGTNRY